jgi:beta-N-acetylhexosaminidase
VASAIARNPVTVFVTADRPTAFRGALGLPAALANLIAATSRTRPAILVSLGNPYQLTQVPEAGSYLIGWRSNAIVEQAVARALAGVAPITGRLPISLPPRYGRGWGIQRRIDP